MCHWSSGTHVTAQIATAFAVPPFSIITRYKVSDCRTLLPILDQINVIN
jgi:hypothetical protein